MYAFSINPDLERTRSAPIQAAKEWAMSYDGRHGPLLSLTQGVPSIPPDEHFLARLGKEAMEPANTTYGGLFGEPQLREALARDISKTYSCQVDADSVAITAGCNMAAQVVFQAVAQNGDEIILPSPWYFNHEMCLDELGIRLVPLQCKFTPETGGFVPSWQDADALVTGKTKAIVLVTPNNPTGSIYPPSLIRSFYDLCKRHKIALILDETYRDFLSPSQSPAHGLFALTDWGSTLISLYSFSKSYSVPGHRVGAIVASSELLNKDVQKILDVTLICAPMPAQMTLAWAIEDEGQRRWRDERRDELLERGRLFRQVINSANATISQERGAESGPDWQGWQIDGLGAYYAFLRSPYTNMGLTQERVGELLAREVGVVVLPGSFFGQGSVTGCRHRAQELRADQQHLRFSIANIREDGIRQLEERLVQLDRLLMNAE